MRSIRRQRGMSGWMLLLLLILGGFGVLVGLKLIPVYLESLKIDKAMQSVLEDREIEARTKGEIVMGLLRRLDIDDVTRINELNWQEFVKVEKKGKQVEISVIYSRVEPLFLNLSILAEFEKHASN
ncbi:MAG: DUF4845 domain-containing protein [Ectothiorhodospiraceae bacterium]|nr:DUF4845 domain-containing protein [Ectothiorhodospiraceae bacterium]